MIITKSGVKKYQPNEIRQRMGFVLRDIWFRLHNRDQNFLWGIIGGTGSGKSYAGLGIAKKLDPNFTVENNVVFEALDLIKKINSGDTYDGMVIIWEEVGVNIDAKEWYSKVNKKIVHMIQTFRKKHICLIMTVPHLDFFDSSVRKMLNLLGQMIHIDRVRNISTMMISHVSYDSKGKKFYYPAPQFRDYETGIKKKVKNLKISKVDSKTAKEYEKKREEFMSRYYIEIEDEISTAGEQRKEKPVRPEDIADELYRKWKRDPAVLDELRNKKNGSIDAWKIKAKYKIRVRQQAYDSAKALRILIGEE